MADQAQQIGGGRRTIGDIAARLAEITDDVPFQDVWSRPEPHDRGARADLIDDATPGVAGHASTKVTETVYRKELRPVLTRGARAMDDIYCGDASER